VRDSFVIYKPAYPRTEYPHLQARWDKWFITLSFY